MRPLRVSWCTTSAWSPDAGSVKAAAWRRVQWAFEGLQVCLRRRVVQPMAGHFDADTPNSGKLQTVERFSLVWQAAAVRVVSALDPAQVAGHTAQGSVLFCATFSVARLGCGGGFWWCMRSVSPPPPFHGFFVDERGNHGERPNNSGIPHATKQWFVQHLREHAHRFCGGGFSGGRDGFQPRLCEPFLSVRQGSIGPTLILNLMMFLVELVEEESGRSASSLLSLRCTSMRDSNTCKRGHSSIPGPVSVFE